MPKEAIKMTAKVLRKPILFCKSQPVFVAAFILAVVTMFIIPPDENYIGYCNFAVLCELFGLMIAVAGLRGAGLSERLTSTLLKHSGDLRKLSLIFILTCFFSSMLITNDVALITFVPLTLAAYEGTDDERSRIMTVVLETVAANLGSMMTPVGNPQNLYIFDEFGLTALQFVQTMLPAGALSLVMIILLSFLIPRSPCGTGHEKPEHEISAPFAAVYGALFIVCMLAVFKVIPYYICVPAAAAAALFTDKKLLLKADYSLLATFLCFFVFVGNISRIGDVSRFMSEAVAGREVLVSALLSQGISNVPAAVMLSGFTENGTALLAGVNIGGLGTPIASMASLISLQFYRGSGNSRTGRYLAVFSAVNFGMLIILLAFEIFVIG